MLQRLGIDIHPGEGRTTLLLAFGFFLVVTFQYAAKTVRQSTFIDSLGAENLPWVYLLVAVCSFPLLRVWMRWAERLPRHTLVAVSSVIVAASLVVFWLLYGQGWRWVPVAFYVWASIAFAVMVSQYWNYASHLFDARQARRLFGLIGAGGLLGGVAGGQLARLISRVAETRSALLVSAVLLCGVALVARAAHRSAKTVDAPAGGAARADAEVARGGFALVRRSRHLRLVAVMVVLGVVAGQVVDLQFNWAVQRATEGLGQRTAFFGNLFSLISAAAFAFQMLFSSWILRTLGVGTAMRVLPVILGLGTVALLAAAAGAPELVLAAALTLKIGENGVRYSLDQSARELLFLPIPAAVRVKAKAFVDVFLQRAAEGVVALMLLPVTFGWIGVPQIGWLTLLVSVGWLVVVTGAYGAYVTSFRAGLKERSMETSVPINLDDVKTVELLVQSLGSADARQVLHSLEILDANGRGNLVPPLLLYHDDPDVRRRTLQVLSTQGRVDAAPLVERRLQDDHPGVRAEAIRVLTGFWEGNVSEMMLPRLHEPDPRVKAAAATCLLTHGDASVGAVARKTLDEMLADSRPEFRAEAVKAIGAIKDDTLEGRLIESLYDRDATVAREAIVSVSRIVTRDGFNPLFVPRLVSLLENRRLKHDAREALVAFGEAVTPILIHFMNDPGESILVRRALPKTLSRIAAPSTVAALVDALLRVDDALLRSQVVDALAARRHDLGDDSRHKIEHALGLEARRYLERLVDLAALGREIDLHYEAPLVRWDTRELDLLTQMVAERVEEHVKTLFGLLALLHPSRDVWAAHRSLVSGRRELRAHALEYLDNTLQGEVRRNVFAVIDDVPLTDKLHAATRQFGVRALTRAGAVSRYLGAEDEEGADGPSLTVAALYSVYTERMEELYPRVHALHEETPNGLVRETAKWVASRIAPGPPGQAGSGR